MNWTPGHSSLHWNFRLSLLPPSHGVDGNVDPQADLWVREGGADVVLEEVPDAVELHDVGRLLAQPELVELDEEVAVQVVEVGQPRPASEAKQGKLHAEQLVLYLNTFWRY